MLAKLCTAALLTSTLVLAQSPGPASTPAKSLAFEVASIHPSAPDGRRGTVWGTQPDGYRTSGQSLWSTIMIAYFPQGMAYWSRERLANAPSWIDDPYDITAKVSEADLPDWQEQGVTLDKKPMFRAMLKTMLADRCHFVAHMVPGPPLQGWSLELGKHAPHLTETRPDEVLPAGMKLPDGGVETPYKRGDKPHLSFYGVTMADVAQFLTIMSAGHPVQDHTGLTGRYDFVVDWAEDPDSKLPEGVIDSNDPDTLSHWNLEALGFRRTPIKLPTDTLIIDHIEKPSAN
jgi:uncharacterized protein (TIGR03435 family)